MNKDRKIMLILLLFTIVFSFSFLNIMALREKRDLLKSKIILSEKKYEKLHLNINKVSPDDIVLLSQLIKYEKSRFFDSTDNDPYKFGINIKGLLEAKGLKVKSYKTLEDKETYLIEFSIEGSSRNYFSFMKQLYDNQKNYNIPYLSIKNNKIGISSTFRIGTVIYE